MSPKKKKAKRKKRKGKKKKDLAAKKSSERENDWIMNPTGNWRRPDGNKASVW